jgi:sortase A
MICRPLLLVAALASAAGGATLLGTEAWLSAKAWLASRLIERAWAAHLADGGVHRPWSWADVHPVARVEVPRLGVVRTVLSGATGGTLAFGLGHVDGTARPGTDGHCAIAGHRDSWAAFLRDVAVGDEIVVTTQAGTEHWRVTATRIVAAEDTSVLQPVGSPRLSLVTCYPFTGLTRSPWRFVAICERR